MGRLKNTKYDAAYSDYLSGLSLAQIADNLGVTRQCVFKAFKKRGFTLRGPNFRAFQVFQGKKYSLRNNGYYGLTTNKRMLMHRAVWEHSFGPIPKKYDIHHIDGDKSNNSISNLECLPKAEHTRKYSPHNNQYTKGRKLCK